MIANYQTKVKQIFNVSAKTIYDKNFCQIISEIFCDQKIKKKFELIEFFCSMTNYINSIKKFLIGSHKKKKRNSLIILKKLNKFN